MFSQILKRATSEQHGKTESLLKIEDHLLSLESYHRLLIDWFGIYEPFEQALDPWWESLFSKEVARRRNKIEALHDDLRSSCTVPFILSEVPRVKRPALSCAESALGAMYVWEGSTLGGTVITSQVRRRLPFAEGKGTRFFSVYGKETFQMWKEFTSFLDNFSKRKDFDEDKCIKAAQATFESFGSWFCKSTSPLNKSIGEGNADFQRSHVD